MVRIAGRRGAALAVSAAVLCLATLVWVTVFGGTGGGGGSGYVAVGPGGATRDARHPVPPDGKVTLVPLPDGSSAASPPGTQAVQGGSGAGAPSSPGGSPHGGPSGTRTGEPGAPGSPASPGSGPPGTPGSPGSGTPQPPPRNRAAHLTVSALQRSAAEQRWCDNVTLTFTNSGDLPAT